MNIFSIYLLFIQVISWNRQSYLQDKPIMSGTNNDSSLVKKVIGTETNRLSFVLDGNNCLKKYFYLDHSQDKAK